MAARYYSDSRRDVRCGGMRSCLHVSRFRSLWYLDPTFFPTEAIATRMRKSGRSFHSNTLYHKPATSANSTKMAQATDYSQWSHEALLQRVKQLELKLAENNASYYLP